MQVEEHSVKYKIAQRGGQKTGFYADQRDSRRLIQQLCREKRVLDLCCYTGGFALNAAVGGAAHVTGSLGWDVRAGQHSGNMLCSYAVQPACTRA